MNSSWNQWEKVIGLGFLGLSAYYTIVSLKQAQASKNREQEMLDELKAIRLQLGSK